MTRRKAVEVVQYSVIVALRDLDTGAGLVVWMRVLVVRLGDSGERLRRHGRLGCSLRLGA